MHSTSSILALTPASLNMLHSSLWYLPCSHSTPHMGKPHLSQKYSCPSSICLKHCKHCGFDLEYGPTMAGTSLQINSPFLMFLVATRILPRLPLYSTLCLLHMKTRQVVHFSVPSDFRQIKQ